jgi:hypothetical protein
VTRPPENHKDTKNTKSGNLRVLHVFVVHERPATRAMAQQLEVRLDYLAKKILPRKLHR